MLTDSLMRPIAILFVLTLCACSTVPNKPVALAPVELPDTCERILQVTPLTPIMPDDDGDGAAIKRDADARTRGKTIRAGHDCVAAQRRELAQPVPTAGN